MNAARFKRWLQGLPTHIILIGIGLVWLLPTIGLLVTSFRPFQDVNENGWWTALSAPKGEKEYRENCGACHGNDGRTIPAADLRPGGARPGARGGGRRRPDRTSPRPPARGAAP